MVGGFWNHWFGTLGCLRNADFIRWCFKIQVGRQYLSADSSRTLSKRLSRNLYEPLPESYLDKRSTVDRRVNLAMQPLRLTYLRKSENLAHVFRTSSYAYVCVCVSRFFRYSCFYIECQVTPL